MQKHSCRAINFHPRTLRAHLRLRSVACRACPVGGSCCSCPRSARATVPRPQPAAAPADRSLESFKTAAPVVVAGLAEEAAAVLASLASTGRPCSVCLSGTKVRSASAEHVRHEGAIRPPAFVRAGGGAAGAGWTTVPSTRTSLSGGRVCTFALGRMRAAAPPLPLSGSSCPCAGADATAGLRRVNHDQRARHRQTRRDGRRCRRAVCTACGVRWWAPGPVLRRVRPAHAGPQGEATAAAC